jgi:molybdate transport system permease protein
MAETPLTRTRTAAAPVVRRRGGRPAWLLALASLPLLLFLLVPLIALVLRVSPTDLLGRLADPEVAPAIWLSIWTTLCTAGMTLLAGTPLAFLLARYRFRGRTALDTLLDLPMVMPPSVAGIALLLAFGRRGMLGASLDVWGVQIAFTPLAVILAQTFVAAPFYVKSATAGFAGVDRDLEQAAQVDGASPTQVIRLITVPLAWPALLGGLVMTWARALGEFGATIIFAGNFPGRTQTMPLAIYLGFERDLDVALSLAFILLLTSFAILLFVRFVLGQRVTLL